VANLTQLQLFIGGGCYRTFLLVGEVRAYQPAAIFFIVLYSIGVSFEKIKAVILNRLL